jgi:hypothetical protein
MRFEAFMATEYMKSSLAISLVSVVIIQQSNVSETVSASIYRVEVSVPETLDSNYILTRLIAREKFIAFIGVNLQILHNPTLWGGYSS